jgi:hypothetical protein
MRSRTLSGSGHAGRRQRLAKKIHGLLRATITASARARSRGNIGRREHIAALTGYRLPPDLRDRPQSARPLWNCFVRP